MDLSDRLGDKVALVTGAGSGIGRASAARFAAEGAKVMCSDVDAQAAEATAELINESGGEAQGMGLDVTDEQDVQNALQASIDRFGKLNVLFNNAGVGGGFTWDQTIDVNLTGVFYGVAHGARLFADQGGGVIINTASIAGLVGLTGPGVASLEEMEPGAGAYIAAKHGVAGLTKQFAVSFGSFGVRVNAIAPGYIYTPMTQEMRDEPEGEEYLIGLHPMGRLGKPEEIASAAAFLASDDASFINGVVLPVDGGYTAR